MKWLIAAAAAAGAALLFPLEAAAASFSHQALAYFVPDKRIRVDAGITDPRGVQLARVYFKAGAQADYIFVPMQQAGGRYVATLPAPSASAGSLEYLLLALDNDGQVSRTDAYKVAARRSDETPAWQSAGGRGDVKVFSEIPNAPKPVAMYSDSLAMDVVESGARLGAAAGLYAGTGGGAASASAATAKSATAAGTTSGTTTAATTTATVGGLSTAAIVGGVVVAGAAVAAAAGGGGGGSGGSGGGTSTPSGPAAFAGPWSGTFSVSVTVTCSNAAGNGSCSASAPFSGTADSAGNFTGSSQSGVWSCSGSPVGTSIAGFNLPSQSFNSTIAANGAATFRAASSQSVQGSSFSCPALIVTFTSSPHRVSGSAPCTGTIADPTYGTCTFTEPLSISGS